MVTKLTQMKASIKKIIQKKKILLKNINNTFFSIVFNIFLLLILIKIYWDLWNDVSFTKLF